MRLTVWTVLLATTARGQATSCQTDCVTRASGVLVRLGVPDPTTPAI